MLSPTIFETFGCCYLHVDLQSLALEKFAVVITLWLEFFIQNIMNTDMTNDAEVDHQDEDTSSSKFIFCIRLQKKSIKKCFLCA